MERIRKS